MEEGRLISTENNPSASPTNTLESTGAAVPVSSYSQNSTIYSLDSLETQTPSPGIVASQPTTPAPLPAPKPPSYGKRRALVVSSAVTALVVVLTAGILFTISKKAVPRQSTVNGIPSQTLDVKGENNTVNNLGLVSGAQALVVKGDIIARGQLKISQNSLIGSLALDNLTQDRTYQLPDSSGTFCLSSNNCNFVTNQVLQSAVDNVDIPATVVVTNITNTVGGATISTSVNGISDSITIQGTTNQVNVSSAGNTITLSTPQNLAITSTPTFGGLTVNGNVSLGQLNSLYTNNIIQTSSGNDITIDAGSDVLTFLAGGRSFIFPTSGGANQQICTTGIVCASGGGQAVLLAPGSAQTDNTTDVSIFINDTGGGGNLLQLQSSGVDRFIVAPSGAVTAGTYNGQTISSAANFTGTLNVVSSIQTPSVLATNIDAASAITLNIGNTNATGVSICNSAACGSILIGNNADPDTITIGDALDPVNIRGNRDGSSIYLGNTGADYKFSVDGFGNICSGLNCSALQITNTPLGSESINIGAAGSGHIINIQGTGSTSINTVGTAHTYIGNGTGDVTIEGATTINSTSTKSFSIGNSSSGDLILQNSTIINNRGNIETIGYLDTPYGGLGKYGNLLSRSETLENAAWTATGITVTANDSASNPAPNTLTTADKLVSSASGTHSLVQTYTTSTNGTYTFSIWVKTNSATQPVQLRIDSTGATPATGTATSITATTTWKRYSVTQTFTGTPSNIKPTLLITNNSATVVAWGAQLELASSMGVYTSTTVGTSSSGIGYISNSGIYTSSATATTVGVVIQGVSQQSADLLQIQNAGETVVFGVGSDGGVTLGSSTQATNLITTRASAASTGLPIYIRPGNVTSGAYGATLYLQGGNQIDNSNNIGGNVEITSGSGSGPGQYKSGNIEIQVGQNGCTSCGGTIKIGTSNNVNSITIGSSLGIYPINIGNSTNGQDIFIGNAQVAGAGAVSIGIGAGNAAGSGVATNLTLGSPDAGTLVLQGGTGGISIGNDAVAKTITIGNTTGATAVTIQSGTSGAISLQTQGGAGTNIAIGTNAVAQSIILGNSTGTTSLDLRSGTGAINIGTNAVGHAITLGNSTGGTSVTLNSGTGAINIGSNAVDHLITLGSGTGASGIILNAGTSGITIGTNAVSHGIIIGSATGGVTTLQSSGGTSVTSTLNVTGAATLQSTLVVQGASATIGTSSQQGSLLLHDGSGQTITVQSLDQAANRVISVPITSSGDTFCLATIANCAGLATTTLQQAYGNDADGSDSIISLTSADGSLVVSNPASLGSSSEFVLKVQQVNIGAKSGLLVTSAGDSTGYAFRVNDDGTDSDSTPLIVNNAGDVLIGTTTTGLAKLVSAVSSSSTSQYQNVAGALGLVNTDPTTSNWVELYFGDDSTNNAAAAISTQIIDHTNNYGDLHLSTKSAAGLSSKLVVLSGGNVGIGDATPASLFTVGSGDLFQVNSSGAIVAVAGITSTGNINIGNNIGLVLGASSNATLTYDGTGDSRVELTGTGATLFVEDVFSLGVDSRTIADNGVGASQATLTLNPNSSYVAITCNDADGCAVTMSETSPIKDGNLTYVINVGTNVVDFADTSGVTELAGNFTAGAYDSIQLLYVSDRWVEMSRSNN